MLYEVKGKYSEKGGFKPFTRSVEAKNEKLAKEKTFCLFTSEHGIKKRMVTVDTVKKAEVK